MRTILLLLLASVVLTTMVPHVGPIDSHVPSVYKVSLDDPPEVRWAQIVKDYKHPL